MSKWETYSCKGEKKRIIDNTNHLVLTRLRFLVLCPLDIAYRVSYPHLGLVLLMSTQLWWRMFLKLWQNPAILEIWCC